MFVLQRYLPFRKNFLSLKKGELLLLRYPQILLNHMLHG